MNIKRFMVMTLGVIAAGIMIGIGGLIVFGVLMAAMVLALFGLAATLLLMTPEQRALWFARMKSNFKGWVHTRTAKPHDDKRLP